MYPLPLPLPLLFLLLLFITITPASPLRLSTSPTSSTLPSPKSTKSTNSVTDLPPLIHPPPPPQSLLECTPLTACTKCSIQENSCLKNKTGETTKLMRCVQMYNSTTFTNTTGTGQTGQTGQAGQAGQAETGKGTREIRIYAPCSEEESGSGGFIAALVTLTFLTCLI